MIETINIGVSANDGTGDPLRTAFNKTNTNFLNITEDGGDEITVTDPTTSTDQTLNTALANIYASGSTLDLQAVTDVGNTITDGTDVNTVSANGISVTDLTDTLNLTKASVEVLGGLNQSVLSKDSLYLTDGTDEVYYSLNQLNFTDGTNQGLITKDELSVQNASDITQITAGAVLVSDSTITDFATLYKDRIQVNSVDYPLPSGASSPLATLADIPSGGYTVVSSNTTASNDTNYTAVANATFTDPSPTEGKGYVVYVRNGTATIGGTGYSVGSLVFRVFHSGSWSTREYKSNLTIDATPTNGSTNAVQSDGVFDSLALKQDKLTVFKNTTQTTVTSTTSETIIYAEEVLANTLSNNTILSFKSRVARGPRVGTCVLKLYLNTVNNLSGSPVAIAQVTINANIGAQPFVREQIFIKDNVLSVAASSNAVTDVTSGVPIFTISTYNINTTYYWILTAQPNTSTDSLVHNFSILERI